MNLIRQAGYRSVFMFASVAIVSFFQGLRAWANPDGLSVQHGSATTQASGKTLQVQASDGALLRWNSFNIQPGETMRFVQPSPASIAWNQIIDQNPSKIWGNLTANGFLVLYNSSGFYFGPGSMVRAAGALVTTSPIGNENGFGSAWQFDSPPPVASIINYGEIHAGRGGSLFLVSEKIENHGVLSAPDGTLGLYAGKELLVSERPDARGLSVHVQLPQGSIDNNGKIIADGGSILLNAQVVNQNGLIQANSIRNKNGSVELVASDEIQLGSASLLSARGEARDLPSDGGSITIRSTQLFQDASGSQIDVSGGRSGGDGGRVEISAPIIQHIRSVINGTAQAGFHGGIVTIDPQDIILANSAASSIGNGSTLQLNINSAFVGMSQINLVADRDITLASGTQWNLPASTGIDDPGSTLTLRAGRNITFAQNSSILGGDHWSLNFEAGTTGQGSDVQPGVGSIYLNGGIGASGPLLLNGSVQTGQGNIIFTAGKDILLGSGSLRTTAGGAISLTAIQGDINAGNNSKSLEFTSRGYQIGASGVGGITTDSGGDLTLSAGNDIISLQPTSGTYGFDKSHLSVTAGRDVIGSFLVQNGDGIISAGRDVGSMAGPANLSLVSGSWSVTAARDLYLNEVRNPNGIFNANRPASLFNNIPLSLAQRVPHFFDYAAESSVTLNGGNSVQLLGSNLQRPNDQILPIYPPSLEIHAGAGGVILGNDLILYPSPVGQLKIVTTQGGSVQSPAGDIHQIIMSDSSDPNYATFASGHASVPLHENDSDPVAFDISGSLKNIFLSSPKRSVLHVAGDTLNFAMDAQNLHAGDQSELIVGGDFSVRGDRTSAPLASVPNPIVFDPVFSTLPDLGSHFTYNPATAAISFQGRMTDVQRDFLLNPMVKTFDSLGAPILDASGNPVLAKASYIPAATVLALYAASQDVPLSTLGLRGIQISGPGNLLVSAHNLDLGVSKGIRSVGGLVNPALHGGAAIDVELTGDLILTASQIASFSGAPISISAGHQVNVGSQEDFSSDDVPKGIFTSSGGNVNISAVGSINVNGSRIAAYDGGNVRVVSATGDINAGEGGLGEVVVFRTLVDAVTGQTVIHSSTIPGSGILATTLRDSTSTLGDVYVEATQGNINANKGGILQLAFNGRDPGAVGITLKAGGNIDAGNSGVIGNGVTILDAQNVSGLFVAKRNIDITAQQSVSVTALAQGSINVNAESASGTFVGSTSVSVSADAIRGNLVSDSVSASGDKSAASVGVAATSAARSDGKVVADPNDKIAQKNSSDDEDETWKKKKSASAILPRSTGRVTVILPKKS